MHAPKDTMRKYQQRQLEAIHPVSGLLLRVFALSLDHEKFKGCEI